MLTSVAPASRRERRISRAAVSSASRSSSSDDVADRAPRRDARVPERLGLPHVPDAGDEPLVQSARRRPPAPCRRGAGWRASCRSPAPARGCPGRARCDRARVELEDAAAVEERLRALAAAGRATAARQPGRPRRARASSRTCAGGCARSRRPRSGRSGSCRRPRRTRGAARRPAPRHRSPRPRGFGDSAATRSPTSTCSRRAARWRLSPSGTRVDFVTLVSDDRDRGRAQHRRSRRTPRASRRTRCGSGSSATACSPRTARAAASAATPRSTSRASTGCAPASTRATGSGRQRRC